MDEKHNSVPQADERLENIINEVMRERQTQTDLPAQPESRSVAQKNTQTQKPKSGTGRGKRIAAIAGGVVAALVVAAFGYTYLYGNVYYGVSAGSISLSGLNQAEAEAEINAAAEELLGGKTVDLKIHESTYSVDIGAVTDGLDSKATAEAAMAYGRSGNPLVRVGKAIGALFGGPEVDLTVSINEEALKTRLQEISDEALTPPVDPSYTIEGDELVIDTGKNGVDFNRETVAQTVSEKIRTMNFEPYEVEVETEQQAAVDLEAIQTEITCSPQNAIVDKTDGSTIIPSKDGIAMDLEQAKTLLGDGSEQTYRIPLTLTAAEISAEDLAEVLFRDTLASTSTSLNAGNYARTNNVRLACQNINGTILNPGEEFSYNGVVGERTAARGFKSAGAYSQGRVVDEVGGGVCQPSSTLYMAVLRADLEVTKRFNHSFTVAYTPLGEDATVSWGGPDFCFKNNTPYPIKILASQTGSSCNMTIIGTKTSDKTVTLKTEVLSTTPFSVIEKQDNSLAPGTTKVDQTGSTGYKTVTYKIITENGETRTEKANNSSYSKRDKIVLVGPAAPEPQPETPAETPAQEPSQPQTETPVNPEA